jgi:hypothetical protein
MAISTSWNVLRGGDWQSVVLGVDFPAATRPAAGFAELAAMIGTDGSFRFLQTRPPAVPAGQRPCGDAYIDPWIEGVEQGRYHVLAVLGHRVGSVYAAAIAQRISRWQPMPRVILFDPEFASNRQLGLEFHKEISAISSLLSDAEIESTRKTATEISESVSFEVADAAAEAARVYREVSSIAYERVGLGGAYEDKLMVPFDSYISWLSAADQIDPGPVWKRSTAIVSSDYSGRPATRPGGEDTSGLIGRSVPFDVAPADLLRSDSVAHAVCDLLAAR